MSNKTAMQELIEDVQANMDGCYIALNEDGLSAVERRHYNASIIVAKDVIKKATELREKEKRHLLMAFISGVYYVGNSLSSDKMAENYYNETFK